MGIQVALGGHSAVSMRTGLPMITVPITAIGGAIAGHTYGQTTIAKREREREQLNELVFQDEEENHPGYYHLPAPLTQEPSAIRLTGAVDTPDERRSSMQDQSSGIR
jgi:hypothetical protein